VHVPDSHADLVRYAVRWLRGHHRCSVVFAEISTSAPLIPDAIGWRRGWSILVECKTSRSDFHADRHKLVHRHPENAPGQERWYLVPLGLVRRSEVPEGWGLAEVRAGRVHRVVNPPPATLRHERMRMEMDLLLSAVRRHELGVEWRHEQARFAPYRPV
jgi:hypothetical protein